MLQIVAVFALSQALAAPAPIEVAPPLPTLAEAVRPYLLAKTFDNASTDFVAARVPGNEANPTPGMRTSAGRYLIGAGLAVGLGAFDRELQRRGRHSEARWIRRLVCGFWLALGTRNAVMAARGR